MEILSCLSLRCIILNAQMRKVMLSESWNTEIQMTNAILFFFFIFKWYVFGQIPLLQLICFISSTFMTNNKTNSGSGHIMLKHGQFQLYHVSHFLHECSLWSSQAVRFFSSHFLSSTIGIKYIQSIFSSASFLSLSADIDSCFS